MTNGDQINGADFIAPADFAQRTGLSLATVGRYIKSGRIPSLQPAGFRGRRLVPVSALALPPVANEKTPATLTTPVTLLQSAFELPKLLSKEGIGKPRRA
jgi:hypothetical protein